MNMLDSRCLSVLLSLVLSCRAMTFGADPPSPAAAMINLLKSNRVAEARLGTVVKLICERGNETDLQFILDQALLDGHWQKDLRVQALNSLIEASRNRIVAPNGDLSELTQLIDGEDQDLAMLAIELVGLWRVDSSFDALQRYTSNPKHSRDSRSQARDAMARISPDRSRGLLVKLIESDPDLHDRISLICTLTEIDLHAAAIFAAMTLSHIDDRTSPAELLDGFLDQSGGSRVLAEEITKKTPSADTAKLALRHMFSIGRTDPELTNILSKIAGIAADPPIPTAEELAALIEEVNAEGDAVRGEQVFRRQDLSCMNCHAVSKAGGQIGPDLSAIGASSPVEYVVMSVMDPDQAIKEAYHTLIVVTVQGRVFQGIVTDRQTNALVLKDATGKEITIPIDDIDEETEGKSLMPKGLVKFMTHAELIDLSKFLSSLGKPGPFAVRTTQRMQRWRFLTAVPEGLVDEVPNLSTFEDLVLRSTAWKAVYSRVNGELPISEIVAETDQDVIYVQGNVDVSTSGLIEMRLNSTEGLTLWVGEKQLDNQDLTFEAMQGVQPVTIRIDTRVRQGESVVLEFTSPARSTAKFAVVDGQ